MVRFAGKTDAVQMLLDRKASVNAKETWGDTTALMWAVSERHPAAALVFRASGPQVALIGPDNRVRFTSVTIARDEGSVVELGSGVKPGDKVALNISNLIADGQEVSVNEGESGPAGSLASVRTEAAQTR